jgi:hypothetical protein
MKGKKGVCHAVLSLTLHNLNAFSRKICFSNNTLAEQPQTLTERALAWPLAWQQHKTTRFKASSLLQKKVTVNLLRQVLNVSWADTHLGKVQFPSIHHFHHTHYLSRSFGRR